MLVFFKRFKSILSVFLVVLIACDSQDVLSLDYQECAVDTDSEVSSDASYVYFSLITNLFIYLFLESVISIQLQLK